MYPTLYRPANGQLQLSLPFRTNNREWLRDQLGDRVHLTWIRGASEGYWAIARRHLMPLLHALVAEHDRVAVHLEFNLTVKCDHRCRDARNDDCVCSCLGTNHKGAAGRTWFEVGQTTLISTDTRVVVGWVTAATLRRWH
jgi:hypothetical protein